jgi:hypothetical protein
MHVITTETARGSFIKWALGAALAATFATGCGGPLTYKIHGSTKAPEIDAVIVADVNKDGSFTTLKINIEHLAPPDRLGSGNTFVIWTTADRHKWHRVGGLKYDDGPRKAMIEGASVPVTAFDLQITVEKDAAPETPSGDVVLLQHVN